MNIKGISILALCLIASVPALALEERIELLPGKPSAAPAAGAARTSGEWLAEGAVLRKGYKGAMGYVLADQAYASDPSADLLLHFDSKAEADETRNWSLAAGRDFSIDATRALLGSGAASFRGPGSALSIKPGPSSLFGGVAGFRDFSVEFWLYPANAGNGETILLWRSLRKLRSGTLSQQISCAVAGGRLIWSFAGFFCPPGAQAPAEAGSRLELRARSPLVPRAWSHHLLRFDGDTGLIEYLVDGKPEAVAYATASGREGGTVYQPTPGAASPLEFCPEYSGLADELRISRRFVEEPSLRPYGRDPALVVSPIADLGFGNSRLVSVDAELKAPGAASVELSYRIADSWAAWRAVDASTESAWTPLRPGEALPASARGRYAQVRALLYADGGGRLTPELGSISLRYEPDPPPPAPASLVAYPKDGAVELHWTKVPEADLSGYLVYYGDRPGEYFGEGADQGPSPIDAGDTTTLKITGIPNGRLLYFAIAAYDAAPGSRVDPTGAALDRAEARAGEFSPETSARPSRTAR
jgi:hypothetical protein